MSKRECLETLVYDVESLSAMSKSYPQIFNRVVSDKELEQLEELASDLAANVEIEVNKSSEDKRSFILIGDNLFR